MSTQANEPDLRMYTMHEVRALTGFSRTHIYRLEAAGQFPRRIKLSVNSIRFWKREVDAWLLSRPRGGPIRFDDGDECAGVSP